MRTSVAMWSIGFAVGLAVLSIKPSEPWRDFRGTTGASIQSGVAGAAAATAALQPRPQRPIEATAELEGIAKLAAGPIPGPTFAPVHEPIPNAVAVLSPAPDEAPPEPIDDRVDRLVAAGFEPERAAEIVQREAELRRAAYFAEYEASGTVRPFGAAAQHAGAQQLHAELGDGEYERYLEALGQPTRVVVGMVEADSLAAHAGLQPDDEILAYAGRRVFNARELNALMLAGSSGEIVATTIVRDGHTMELYVTRGPLGIAQRP